MSACAHSCERQAALRTPTQSVGPQIVVCKYRGGLEVIPMATNKRQTGSKAASQAAKVLSNPKSTKAEKAAAASALSQTPSRKK